MPTSIRQPAATFEEVDANHDGVIDRREWASAMSSASGSSRDTSWSTPTKFSVKKFSGEETMRESVKYSSGGSAKSSGSQGSNAGAARQHRELEQEELRGLNGRLEMCIMRQRERDENEAELRREIENLRGYFENEIETLTSTHEFALQRVKSVRDHLAEENQLLKREVEQIAPLRSENDKLKAQLAAMQKELDAMQGKNEQLLIEIKNLKNSLQSSQMQMEKAMAERDAVVGELSMTQKQITNVNDIKNPNNPQTLQFRINTLKDELKSKNDELKDAQRALRREREKNSTAVEEKVREIREEYNSKLMELCGQRENALNGKMVELRIKMEQEYVQQLNEKSDELQRAMERLAEAAQATAEAEAKLHMIENDPDKMVAADQSKRIHDLQKKLADAEKAHRLEIKSLQNQHNRAMGEMSNERDALKKANSQFEKELDGQQDWEAQIHSLSEDVNFWKGECEKLQQSLHTQKELHRCIAEQEALLKGQERLVGTLRQQISRTGDQLARKDEEYESLLGLKVALDMEIKSYRWLLENEENRLGISSKKRKTAGSSSSSSSSSSVTNGGSSQSSSTYNSTYTSKRTSASSTSGGGSSFEEIDANHDGVIDRSEWNNAVSKKQIRP